MPRHDSFVDDIPRSPSDGETVTYMDEGNLVTVTKHNGEEYKTIARTTENTSASDTIDTMEHTEDSIGGANFSINIGANNIDVRDGNDTQRAIFGQITSTDYGIKCMDSSGNELIGLYGNQNTIAGWSVTSDYIHNSSLDNSKHMYIRSGESDNLPRINVKAGNNDIFNAGVIEANKSGVQILNSSQTEVFRIDSAGACQLAGWHFTEDLFRSEINGARIELNAAKNRMSIFDDNNEKVVMGYLNGLAKNDGTGNWASNDYGFWALAGDTLTIDGDMEYESGDWMVQNDASLKIKDAAGDEIIRLGTYSGAKGLFIGDDIDQVVPLARYEKTQILIGVDGSASYLKYTTAGGLVIRGDITVEGDLSTQLFEGFQNVAVSASAVAGLPTAQYQIIGTFLQTQTTTGLQFVDADVDSTWDTGFRYKTAFKREHAPVFTWDVKLLHADPQGDTGVENRYEMLGWFDDATNANYTNIEYGVYFRGDDLFWFGVGNNNDGTIFANRSDYEGSNWRIVIKVLPGGGAIGQAYKDGDFTTPFATNVWAAAGGDVDNLYLGNAFKEHGNPKLEHQQLAAGAVQPSVPTVISGGLIKTGKIQSTDEKTYFDLDNDRLIVNNGTDDRVLIGDISTAGDGTEYGVQVSFPGTEVIGAANDDIMFSSKFALPKYQVIYMDGRELRQTQSADYDTPYPTWYRTATGVLFKGDLTDYSGTSGYCGDLDYISPPNKWDGSDSTNVSSKFGEMKIAHPYFHDKSIKYLRFNCIASAGTGIIFGVASYLGGSSGGTLAFLSYLQNEEASSGGWSSGTNTWNAYNYTTGWGLAPNDNHTDDTFNISSNAFVKGSSESLTNVGSATYDSAFYSLSVRVDVTSLTHGTLYTCIACVGAYSLLDGTSTGKSKGEILMPMTTAHGYEMTANTLTSFG